MKVLVKYYVKRIRNIIQSNIHYETRYRGDEPIPYIMTDNKDYEKIMKYLDKLLKENK